MTLAGVPSKESGRAGVGEARRISASEASAMRRASSGLVSDSTTGPRVFDTRTTRYRRMRYNVIASSTMMNACLTRGGRRRTVAFVTLTYRPDVVPQPEHVSGFIRTVRKHLARRGEKLHYVWVAELTQRGVLHYHLILWLPHGWRIPKPDESGWWPHGWSNIKAARSPVGYLANYAGKLKGKGVEAGFAFPKGFRLYGVGGLDGEDRMKRSWCNLPGWLRDRTQPEDRCKRIRGGGFISRETLDYWPSPFKIGRVVVAGGGAFVSLIPALPEGIELWAPTAF